MRSEIAEILPAPIHAALIIVCAVTLVVIAVSQVVREIRDAKRAKAAHRKLLEYPRIAGGSGNRIVGRPPAS